VISFEDFGFTYPEADRPVVEGVTAQIREGDFALVIGGTGSGKSSLLRAVNGLVPYFTGGHVEGRVITEGRDTRNFRTREFADVVGYVGQNPLAGFVTDVVEDELAYVMEQLAIEPDVMRRRVEETLDLLGIAHLRRRALATLSGGEQQRVAIGAVLTGSPRILVLDEPTSALDPVGAEEILAGLLRLVHDVGVTVLAAEHRLERVLEYADQVLSIDEGRSHFGTPAGVAGFASLAPPVVELGRALGWDPLPLSVRDARRRAADLRTMLAGAPFPADEPVAGDAVLTARGVSVRFGSAIAVKNVDLVLREGEITALMGRNGSGKSSLLWALHGVGRRSSGDVVVRGKAVTLVPQTATDLLYRTTVDAECRAADAAVHAPAGTATRLFERLLGEAIEGSRHPRDLSEGQRLALALALQLVADPEVVLLDEPTRGLDYAAKRRLREILRELAAQGRAVVVASHDVEFVAGVAHRVVVMAEGEVVTDAPVREALTASPMFSPQIAKVVSPSPLLTVDEVRLAVPELLRHG
jgi:energy-coupling factor transport system ATP-binding protein